MNHRQHRTCSALNFLRMMPFSPLSLSELSRSTVNLLSYLSLSSSISLYGQGQGAASNLISPECLNKPHN